MMNVCEIIAYIDVCVCEIIAYYRYPPLELALGPAIDELFDRKLEPHY